MPGTAAKDLAQRCLRRRKKNHANGNMGTMVSAVLDEHPEEQPCVPGLPPPSSWLVAPWLLAKTGPLLAWLVLLPTPLFAWLVLLPTPLLA